MSQFKFIGKLFHTKCEMCGTTKDKQSIFEKQPHPAVRDILVDKSSRKICKKCAQREIGTKRKKELNELEENS